MSGGSLPGCWYQRDEQGQASSGGPSLVLYRWRREPEGLYTRTEDSFAAARRDQVAYFAACIRTGQSPVRTPATDSRLVLVLILALASRESCQTGETVGMNRTESGAPNASCRPCPSNTHLIRPRHLPDQLTRNCE